MKWRAGEYNVELDGEKLYIGDSPKLIINLKTQKNFICYEEENIPYKKEIRISPDLLQRKRPEVFQTAVKYYYQQACEIAEGIQIAREYGNKANRTITIKEPIRENKLMRQMEQEK